MRSNPLGNTGLTVSEIGLGAWQLGSITSQTKAFALLDRTVELGITFIDTSDNYSKSEVYIGKWLKLRRPTGLTIATKASCGPDWKPADIRAMIDRSLSRLQLDTVDILKLHNPGLAKGGLAEVYGVLADAKAAGKIRFTAISEDAHEAQACLEAQPYEVLQVDYSMITRQPEESLFAYTREHGIGIIARMIFGRYVFDRKIKYNWEKPMQDRAEKMRLKEWFARHPDYSPTELLLRYVISTPDLNCALVGTADPDHLAENVALANKGPLPQDVLADFRTWVGEK